LKRRGGARDFGDDERASATKEYMEQKGKSKLLGGNFSSPQHLKEERT